MKETKLTRTQAQAVIDSMKGAISRELKFGRRVGIEGFGIFQIVRTKPLSGRNPRTGAAIAILAKNKAIFLPSRLFRTYMNAII